MTRTGAPKSISARVTPEFRRRVVEAARARGITVADWLIAAAEGALAGPPGLQSLPGVGGPDNIEIADLIAILSGMDQRLENIEAGQTALVDAVADLAYGGGAASRG